MTWSNRIRRAHRWVSIAFTACVVANVLVNVTLSEREQLVLWVGLSTLVPLFFLLFSGLYLFVLPYTGKKGTTNQ